MTGRQPVAWFQFVFVGTMVRYESHGFGWGERRHVGLRDGKRDLRQFRRIRIADVHFGFIRMELEFEAEQEWNP